MDVERVNESRLHALHLAPDFNHRSIVLGMRMCVTMLIALFPHNVRIHVNVDGLTNRSMFFFNLDNHENINISL